MTENKSRTPSFEQVYSEFRDRIFRLAFRLLNNPSEAEDAAQEVFLKAYRSYGKFRGESAVYSWLYRIALNECLERLRKGKRKKEKGKSEVSLDKGEDVADQGVKDPLARLADEEVRCVVSYAIEELPDKYRRPVILRDIEGMSYEQVAAVLGVSIDVVGVRLLRGRGMLRRKLKREDLEAFN